MGSLKRYEIHPVYHSAFGYKEGNVWKIVGHVERFPGWEDRLEDLIYAWNNYVDYVENSVFQ